jgi:putative SOS response-associated peptidase YedK
MCGRYSVYEFAEIQLHYGLEDKAFLSEENYNVAPGQFLPIVILENGKKKIESMKWGLVPSWAKDTKIGYKLINAREESIFEKPMWKGLVKHTRALVPARGFYEWKLEDKEKQPYFIHVKNRSYFAFAGLYSEWKDVEGKPLYTFTIITTEANKEMSKVHNRMPVILELKDEDKWLNPELTDDELQTLLHPSADGTLTMYPVSKDVNKPSNNNPNLLDLIELAK